MQADRVDEVVQRQAVVPGVFQVAGQVPWPENVAGFGRHQTGSEHVHGIKDEGWLRLEIAQIQSPLVHLADPLSGYQPSIYLASPERSQWESELDRWIDRWAIGRCCQQWSGDKCSTVANWSNLVVNRDDCRDEG